MKKKTFYLIMALICGMSIMFTQCSDDSGTSAVKLSGKVSYTTTSGASMGAGGAVVKVYTGSSAEGEYSSSVADADGMYSLTLTEGDYFVVATFNTENQNNLKSDGVDGMSFISEGVAVSVGSSDLTQDIELMAFSTDGDDVVSLGDWSKEAHSKITWKTLYHGETAQLTGGFGLFDFTEFNFDQANPSATVIKAWVQLSTINTHEPGRDGPAHCVQDDLGVVYNLADTAADGSLNPTALDASTDTAWFNSKSVEAYGNGYLAKGDLIFKGVTKEVDMFFLYNGQYNIEGRTATNPYAVFEGEFTFDAANDYGVDYSGGDEIEVNIHLQMLGPAI